MHQSDDPDGETFAVNCYLDESATDGGSPEAVVAGVLMNRSRCVAFDASWTEFLNAHQLKALHMKDFGSHGSLASLSETERRGIFRDAAAIINRHKLYSIAATITYAKYVSELKPSIRKAMSVYGFCFLLAAYSNHLLAVSNKYTKNIGFILDSGNPYAAHVRGAHAALKEWQLTYALNAGSLTFDDDEEIGALQAADLVAWSVRRRATNSPFGKGFEPLLGIFNDAHHENAYEGALLEALAGVNSLTLPSQTL